MAEYVLGLYEKSIPNTCTIREKLMLAHAAGYDFLELSIDETDEKLKRTQWTAQECRAVLRDMQETGLPIRSICLSGHRKYPLGHPDPAMQERSLEILQGAIRLAEGLGVRIIQLAGYDVYYEEGTSGTREAFAKNLRIGVEMAAQAGVILAFETMETPFLNTVGKAMEWVNSIRSPYLQIYPDVGNLTNAALESDVSVPADMETGRGHIVALHLKETRPGVYREVPYGMGQVDFASVTMKAWELGVRRYLAEFWYTGNKDWQSVLTQNNRFLRGFLEKAHG